MNLRSEICEWSRKQPPWRRDLMRRVANTPTISANDEAEILGMLVAEHGGPPAAVAPKPLAIDDLPATSASSPLLLVSVSELLNVNKLAENQMLAFGPRLNVIYGPTGTGKSSYTRIFKRSCRAVDDEPVLGNVYTRDTAPPQATITIATDGGPEALRVDLTAKGPAVLSPVMVFDGRCATVYATDETVAFTPMTLRIFDRLAATQTLLRERVDIATLAGRRPPFADIALGTVARRLVDKMTADTDLRTVKSLAEVDEKATARLAELEVALAKLKQSGPEALAARAEREATAVAALLDRLQQVARGLAPEAGSRLAAAREAVKTKTAAVEAAAAAFASEPLATTGNPGWLVMWNAARQFFEHDCGESFPPTEGAICPFCQQPVGADATVRLARLEQFVKSTVEREAEQARTNLERELATLTALNVDELAHLAGVGILEIDEPQARATVGAFIETARMRAQALAAGTDADVPVAPIDVLDAFVIARRAEAAAQHELVDPDHQRALTAERDELRPGSSWRRGSLTYACGTPRRSRARSSSAPGGASTPAQSRASKASLRRPRSATPSVAAFARSSTRSASAT